MELKVLNALFPSYSVTALAAIPEHFAVTEYLIHRPKRITPGLLFRLSLCFAALVSGFPSFLACHNKSIRLSYR